MPTTLPGVTEGQAAVQLRTQDEHQPVPGGRDRVRQGRARGHGHRSRALLDGRDHDPPPAPLGVAPASRDRAGTRAGRPRGSRRVLGLVWPEQTPETLPELVAKLDRASRLPGWTSAWTAPARARMDMMSTNGVRTPVGIRIVAASAGASRRPRRRAAGVGHAAAGHAERGVRVARRRALADLPAPTRRRWRSTTSTRPRAVDDQPDDDGRSGRRVAADRQGLRQPALRQATSTAPAACTSTSTSAWTPRRAPRWQPQSKPYRVRVATDMSMKREDADELREVTVRSSTEPPVPLALLGHPIVRDPARDDPHRGQRARRLRLRRSERRDGRRELRTRRRGSPRPGAGRGESCTSSPGSGSSGPGSRSSWPRASGG